ncbi:MAG: carbohydrate ABC transporter permease [Treponema sp.]|jgi:ABC-type glycerol-3-phosphate transport system permease component|nr:carbohydrate ABC transporter permease [Treponema sp.]
MKRKVQSQIILIVVLLLMFFVVLFPLVWAVVVSFDRSAMTDVPPFSLWPRQPSLHAYRFALKTVDLGKYYINTIIVTVANTILSVFFAMACGYAFAKGQFKLKGLWFFFMLAVMIIPFESRLIPLFLQYQQWGMIDTFWPLILGAPGYVYGIFFTRQNIFAIPDSLRESAFLDGAGEWKIFFSIIIPLSKPAISALSILQVLANWNSYLWPLVVLRSPKNHVISVGLAYFNNAENSAYYAPKMAIAVLSAVPLITIFLILQKYIVQSMAMQGIKQ